MRLIKMYGWEDTFRANIDSIRVIEIEANKKASRLNYIEKSISMASVLIIASFTFIIIHMFGSV